jgi:hypothetical protein
MAASRVANKLPSGFGSILLAVVPSFNLNATGDTLVAFPDTPTKFRVRAVAMTNGSINPSTARFGIYTAAAAGGMMVVMRRRRGWYQKHKIIDDVVDYYLELFTNIKSQIDKNL